jgi:hypothetical protein
MCQTCGRAKCRGSNQMCGHYQTRRKTFARARIKLVHLEGKMKGLRDGEHPCGATSAPIYLAVVNFGIRLQMPRFEIGWLQFRGIPMRRTG